MPSAWKDALVAANIGMGIIVFHAKEVTKEFM